jgi:hypothetical protein
MQSGSLLRIGFAEAERRLRRSGAKASPKRSEGIGIGSAEAKAEAEKQSEWPLRCVRSRR